MTHTQHRPETWAEIESRVNQLGFKYPTGGENIGRLVIDMLLRIEGQNAALSTIKDTLDYTARAISEDDVVYACNIAHAALAKVTA